MSNQRDDGARVEPEQIDGGAGLPPTNDDDRNDLTGQGVTGPAELSQDTD